DLNVNNINSNIYRNTNIWNRPGNWNRPGYPYRPYYGYHSGWYHGGWNWNSYPSYWAAGAGALAGGWLLGGATNYVNPYYIAPAVESSVVYDYSTPIVVPQPVYIESQPTNYVVE